MKIEKLEDKYYQYKTDIEGKPTLFNPPITLRLPPEITEKINQLIEWANSQPVCDVVELEKMRRDLKELNRVALRYDPQ